MRRRGLSHGRQSTIGYPATSAFRMGHRHSSRAQACAVQKRACTNDESMPARVEGIYEARSSPCMENRRRHSLFQYVGGARIAARSLRTSLSVEVMR